MFALFLAFVIIAAGFVTGEITSIGSFLRDDNSSDVHQRQSRQARFFPIFSVVKFANSECAGTNSFSGTCFTRKECSTYGGIAAGTCANKFGACCTFKKECASTTNVNNTYFVNPGYYQTYGGGERCTITVNKCPLSNICQLRIDFLDLTLSQPNANGTCDNDFILISGGSTNVPRICGDNANQHVYVEFDEENPIVISVNTNMDYRFARRWNIRIRQIACDSPWRAPSGCMQYYTDLTGAVTSFNYGTATNPRIPQTQSVGGTRQMQNLNYGVCVRMALGYCTIEWSQAETNSFAISGDSGIIDLQQGIDYSSSGASCDHNYVIVPNPSTSGNLATTDRFCGNGFTTKTTSSKPYVLYVVTNPDPRANIDPSLTPGIADPPPDFENRGFILNYRQIPCAI